MAEPLFLPSSGIGSSPESLSRQPFPSCFLGSAPGTLSCLLLAPSLVLPATSLRDFPRCIFLYRVCSSLILSLPPPASSRAPFSPLFPSVLPRILACAFHAGFHMDCFLLLCFVFLFLLFFFFLVYLLGCKKKINISFVVPLSTRSIAAIFIRNFPERVGRNGDDAGISTKPQTSINPYLL